MTVKVVNRKYPEMSATYHNVIEVRDVFNDNGCYCHQLVLEEKVGNRYFPIPGVCDDDNQTATYVATEWDFFKLDFVRMF